MRAPRKKRRSFKQIMEEDSGRLLRERLPKEWAIHGYAPDYGIDGAVELFQFLDEGREYAETLGETLFFQLKSTKCCDLVNVNVPRRGNVEKGSYSPTDELVDMQVVRYNFDDTDELVTIEAMGAGAVVVLFLACLQTDRMFFLNLTDAIDKVLTPESPEWREQGSKIIHIPARNEIAPGASVLGLLRFYALRPKLLALFTKIHFQWAELHQGRRELEADGWRTMALHFTDKLLRLDVWGYEGWGLLPHYRLELESVRALLGERGRSWEAQQSCLELWSRLDALGRIFEDVTREWGLPTALGYEGSYH